METNNTTSKVHKVKSAVGTIEIAKDYGRGSCYGAVLVKADGSKVKFHDFSSLVIAKEDSPKLAEKIFGVKVEVKPVEPVFAPLTQAQEDFLKFIGV
jgi:hypothetical protein